MMKLPEIDEEEIDKMILDKNERDFKSRLWNNLNREWITEQNEKKRKKKEHAKKIKRDQQLTNSSVAQSMLGE